MSTDVTIEWLNADLRPDGKEDACWYVSNEPYTICRVRGRRTFDVRVNGEMRVYYFEPPLDVPSPYHVVVRYSDDWDECGIKNDVDVHEAAERGEIEWDENPWFEYVEVLKDGSYSNDDWEIDHTLSDSLEHAVMYAMREHDEEGI